MKDTLITEENNDKQHTVYKRAASTSARIADAGSLHQAGEGVSRNVSDLSNSFSSVEASIGAFLLDRLDMEQDNVLKAYIIQILGHIKSAKILLYVREE